MSSIDAPSVWKMRLTFAFCSAKPNWMPRKPKHMFQICQNVSVGFAVAGVSVIEWDPVRGSVRGNNDQVADIGVVQRPATPALAAGVVGEVGEVAHVRPVEEREAAWYAGLRGVRPGRRIALALTVGHDDGAGLRRSIAAPQLEALHGRGDPGVDRAVGVAVAEGGAVAAVL